MCTMLILVAVLVAVYTTLLVLHHHHTKLGLKVVRCNWFPPKGYKAITLLWWLVVRRGCNITLTLMRHERIHVRQQSEMLLLPFFLWYGLEFLFRLCQYRDQRLAYKNISFEREAYAYDKDSEYLKRRKRYAWFHHLKKENLI